MADTSLVSRLACITTHGLHLAAQGTTEYLMTLRA